MILSTFHTSPSSSAAAAAAFWSQYVASTSLFCSATTAWKEAAWLTRESVSSGSMLCSTMSECVDGAPPPEAAAGAPAAAGGCSRVSEKLTSLPPNPKHTPHGRRSHRGARVGTRAGLTSPADPKKASSAAPAPPPRALCSCTLPSKLAVEHSPGTVGDHCTSKFQLSLGGSSLTTSPVIVSQHSVRLSLPHVSSRPESAGHQDMASTPLVCPTNSFSGEMELRRSHTCSAGERSSSEATMSCVARSGCHCMAEQRRAPLGSEKEMTGRCFLRS
mmetsp:Transcript_13317/g.48470  ORF Transcript_13317/g.48470 Transcript_13317/m.48470 type:complete len:274 (+) Transcript_13317:1486-2307(+)